MKIATFNIDWLKNKQKKIQEIFEEHIFDILIITECVSTFRPSQYKYVYSTKEIPLDMEFDNLIHSTFIKKGRPIRVAIYSKYKLIKTFKVVDEYTSICCEFATEIGNIVIYGTILGTQFRNPPFAKNELNNFYEDCLSINKQTKNLCLAGDFNTSFNEGEIQLLKNSRKDIISLCSTIDIQLTTKQFTENIDHVFLNKSIELSHKINSSIFIKKNEISKDHQGIVVEIL